MIESYPLLCLCDVQETLFEASSVSPQAHYVLWSGQQ